jgi:hypothetical protein
VPFHLHFPPWAIKWLAAIGGFGVLYREAIKPMVGSFVEFWREWHDREVWETVKEPKFKLSHTTNGKKYYDVNQEIPYATHEIAEHISRSERSVQGSLRRLEKRGKVKEVSSGWQRKEK